MAAPRNHSLASSAIAHNETFKRDKDIYAPSTESILLMKLTEGTLSKYDDPAAETKVKQLLEETRDVNPSLTEDKAFFILYDHQFDLQEAINHVKESKGINIDDNEDEWITVEKKKGGDRHSQDGSAAGDQEVVETRSAISPVKHDRQSYDRPPYRGSVRRGSYREDQRNNQRGGFSNRRPFNGRGNSRPRGQRGQYRGGRFNNANTNRPYYENNNKSDQFSSNHDMFSPFDSSLFDNTLDEHFDGNLLETQIFTRKVTPSINPPISVSLPKSTAPTYVNKGKASNSAGSWADLASRRHYN